MTGDSNFTQIHIESALEQCSVFVVLNTTFQQTKPEVTNTIETFCPTTAAETEFVIMVRFYFRVPHIIIFSKKTRFKNSVLNQLYACFNKQRVNLKHQHIYFGWCVLSSLDVITYVNFFDHFWSGYRSACLSVCLFLSLSVFLTVCLSFNLST